MANNGDELKSPMSLEDALAAAEVAEDELGISHEPKVSNTEVKKEELPEIGSASFDPNMFDADDIAADSAKNATSAPVIDEKIIEKPVDAVEAKTEEKTADVAEKKAEEKPAAKKEAKPKTSTAKKTSTTSKTTKPKTTKTTPIVDEKVELKDENKTQEVAPEIIAPVVENTPVEEVKDASSKSKKKKKKEEKTPEEISEALKEKLSPEKNFKLLKILVIVLSVLVTGISIYIYIFNIYDSSTDFSIEKLIPLVPFICQLVLVLVTLLVAGTSERKPIGTALKENIQTRQEEKEQRIEEQVSKEISDNLLVPEINLGPRKAVELSNFQIDNFYKKNIEEFNGKYYMQIAKFDDSVKTFTALGATDMELCAVNMVGSSKFDEILNQPRSKTLTAQELATYCMSKPEVFTIKKRGAIDWTFKYNSKSFAIVRENDGSYKTSIKCYPDAATRINDVYMALEDSNFPSGPLWYCFNELRNLPPRVCKYLVDTSCQISQFQQTKTEKLKDDVKKAKDYDIDMHDIGMKFKAGEKVITFPKFTMIFTKGNDADLTTFLTREYPGVDATNYTKEYYYKCYKTDDAISILCPSKGVQEDVIIAIFNEIEKAIK